MFDPSGNDTSDYWDGIYGEIVLGAGVTYPYTVNGNDVTELNMVAQNPPCTYISLTMHVIAVNDTGVTAPLAAGNLATLDAFMDAGTENGSNTFDSTDSFTLSYGTYNNVPSFYTYANNSTSTDFLEGYLNDAVGNIVFVAVIVDNQPNWNGTTSDYQIMLPKNDSPTAYTIWVDVDYTCKPGNGNGGKDHELYIEPIGSYDVYIGETFYPVFTVRNKGDHVEHDIVNCDFMLF